MPANGLTYAFLAIGGICGTALLDAAVKPRRKTLFPNAEGFCVLAGINSAIFGLFLTVCGNPAVALALTLALQALLTVASNAKHAMLGEPLIFADLELFGAVFRHPQFYLSAVAIWQYVLGAFCALALLATLAWLSNPQLYLHLTGLAVMALSMVGLRLFLGTDTITRLTPTPNIDPDVVRLGLYATLMLYWLRWLGSSDPAPSPLPRLSSHAINNHSSTGSEPDLLIIIQCESFADPVELFSDLIPHGDLALPGLEAARDNAWQWGNLEVSGFGAYTMRTEYGVLFGRDEESLAFRRYNPFLTALGETSYALPAQLGPAWHSAFVHPHDMRFYGRDKIMPAAGFAELIGEDRFAQPSDGDGRYVTDASITAEILTLARAAQRPTMIYAVTIENHGPWTSDGTQTPIDLTRGYLQLVRKGDQMLTDLIKGLGDLGKSATLVFFGDHRPSIPGTAMPSGDRHTPYVIIRLDAEGHIVPGKNERIDLPPAALHHTILETTRSPTL